MRTLLALSLACSPAFALVQQDSNDADDSIERAALEAAFAEQMSQATLVGSATDSARAGLGVFEDSYRLGAVEKLEGDDWAFTWMFARGEQELPLRVTAQVLWAGDTPVITVDEARIPFVGTYSARVVVHGDRYAGTWDGGDHGGHLWGLVAAPQTAEAAEAEPGVGDQAQASAGDEAGHWPSFRGPRAQGVSDGYETAVEWNVPEEQGVRWSRAIPGMAHSSPVIWGDRIYLTTAVRTADEESELTVGLYGSIMPVQDEGEHELRVLCVDRGTGEILWNQLAHLGTPAVDRHPKGSHAASTPATDGVHVVAQFASEGLYCYDTAGELLWSKDFGELDSGYYMVPEAQWGFASSPVIHDGRLLVQVDVNGDDFLASFDVASGEEQWRTERDEVPTWGSPTVDVRAGRAQVIVNGYKHIGAYDLGSGESLWSFAGGGDIPVPTPVVAHDLVYITNAHGRMAPIYAIDAMAEGEIVPGEETAGGWFHRNRGNYMQTPLIYGEELYLCHDTGRLSVYDARTGNEHYRERLGGGSTGFTSSGVAADGKLYFASEAGEVYVVRAGTTHELLAVNDLGEECMASPAVAEGTLYYRTRTRLVAIGE